MWVRHSHLTATFEKRKLLQPACRGPEFLEPTWQYESMSGPSQLVCQESLHHCGDRHRRTLEQAAQLLPGRPGLVQCEEGKARAPKEGAEGD